MGIDSFLCFLLRKALISPRYQRKIQLKVSIGSINIHDILDFPYVKFLPFGRFFGWKGTSFTHLEDPGYIFIKTNKRTPTHTSKKWTVRFEVYKHGTILPTTNGHLHALFLTESNIYVYETQPVCSMIRPGPCRPFGPPGLVCRLGDSGDTPTKQVWNFEFFPLETWYETIHFGVPS